MIGISLHSRSARHDLDPVAVGQHEVEDRRVRRAHRGARRAPPRRCRSATASKPASRSTTLQRAQDLRLVVADEDAPAGALTSAAPRPACATGWTGSSTTKRRALAGQRLGPHAPAVGLDEAPDDGQAEAGAACRPRRRSVRGRTARRCARARRARCPGPRSTTRTITRSPIRRTRTSTGFGRRSSGRRSRAGWRTRARAARRRPRTSGSSPIDGDAEGVGDPGPARPRRRVSDLVDREPVGVGDGDARPAAATGPAACRRAASGARPPRSTAAASSLAVPRAQVRPRPAPRRR